MALSYVTVAAFRNATNNKTLFEESDERLESLLLRAEKYVDALSGYWTRYEDDQTRLFPRIQDVNSAGSTFIPDLVQEATIAQAEFLFLQTPDDEHGVKEDDKGRSVSPYSPRAKMILKGGGLICRTGTLKLASETGLRYDPDKL